MKRIYKYWICNVEDGWDVAWYTEDWDTYEKFRCDNHYMTRVEMTDSWR